jgi:hypothetical protein
MAKRILVELTEGEAQAILQALGCPLGGDQQDKEAVFIHQSGINAAKRANNKVGSALYGGKNTDERPELRRAIRDLRYVAQRLYNKMAARASCDGGLTSDELQVARRATAILSKTRNLE